MCSLFIFLNCLFETGDVDQALHNNIFIMLAPLGSGGLAVSSWGWCGAAHQTEPGQKAKHSISQE